MAKKKSSAKSSKEQEPQIEEPKILTDENKKATIDKLNKLKGSEVMVLPDEAIVNIPISGSFNKALEGLFFHLMEPLNASQIVHTMSMIKKNFEGISEDKVSNTDRALWTILTILSEIHWQADAQGKMKKTTAQVGNAIHGLLHGVDGATEKMAVNMQNIKKQKERIEAQESKNEKFIKESQELGEALLKKAREKGTSAPSKPKKKDSTED